MWLSVVCRALWASLWMIAATLLSTAILGMLVPEHSMRVWAPTAIGLLTGILVFARSAGSSGALATFLQSRKRLAILAAVLASLAFAQTARQSAFVADSDASWARALPTDSGHHLCLAAYVRAAEINRDGIAPLYDNAAYEHDTTVPSTVVGLQESLGDPFVYPPQALMLPRLGIGLTNRFSVLHAVWVSMGALFFGWIALLVARHLEGQARWVACLLVPAVWISLPVAYNMQYGQIHLLTIAVAMAAMLAFDRDRFLLGGSLLAMAIGWKLFPGLLLLYLLVQRRWRPVLYTVGCSLILAGLTLAVTGWQAYEEFIWGHLPNLLSGQAFDRYFEWGDVTAQMSVAGQARVLGLAAGASKVLGWTYTAGVIVLTVFVAKRGQGRRPIVWLAILNLAAMQSPFAPASYLASGIVWLLSLWVAENWQRRRLALAGVVAWLFAQIVPFFDVLPGLWDMRSLQLVSALLVTTIAIAVCIGSFLVSPPRRW